MLTLALLALIAAAAGLEGAVVPGYGGPLLAAGAALAGLVVWRGASTVRGASWSQRPP